MRCVRGDPHRRAVLRGDGGVGPERRDDADGPVRADRRVDADGRARAGHRAIAARRARLRGYGASGAPAPAAAPPTPAAGENDLT